MIEARETTASARAGVQVTRREFVDHLLKVGAGALGTAMGAGASIAFPLGPGRGARLDEAQIPLRHGHRHPPLRRLPGVRSGSQGREQDAARRVLHRQEATAQTLPALRLRRKRLAATCLFLVLVAAIFGVRLLVEFSPLVTIVVVLAAAALSWRAFRTGVRYGYVRNQERPLATARTRW